MTDRTNDLVVGVECAPCRVCGEAETVTVPVDGYDRWVGGALVQNAFPDLHPDVRELLVSGTHPACWDLLFDEPGADTEWP